MSLLAGGTRVAELSEGYLLLRATTPKPVGT